MSSITGLSSIANMQFFKTGAMDIIPDAVNWTDFSSSANMMGGTNEQRITGIEQAINLEISWTETSPTGNVYYQKNNQTEVIMTTNPFIISVSNYDILRFKQFSTVVRSLVVTVKNASNANTVLDTFTYTGTFVAEE